MNHHILIAFDDSENTQKVITFVIDHLNNNHEITLFHVVPDTAAACGLDSPSLTPYFENERNTFCRLEEQRQTLMVKVLEAAKGRLNTAGFTNSKIYIKAQVQDKGIAADIVREAKNGGYGMVAMGRKSSSSGIKDFFTGSTVQRVLQALTSTPLVIVD